MRASVNQPNPVRSLVVSLIVLPDVENMFIFSPAHFALQVLLSPVVAWSRCLLFTFCTEGWYGVLSLLHLFCVRRSVSASHATASLIYRVFFSKFWFSTLPQWILNETAQMLLKCRLSAFICKEEFFLT